MGGSRRGREAPCITCGAMIPRPGGALRCPSCWAEGFEAPRLATVDDAYIEHQLGVGNPAPARREAEARQQRIEDALA